MCTLITASHLVGPAHLREHADFDVLYVSTRDGKRDNVFRFAGRGAGMTADTASVINHLGPFHIAGSGLEHEKSSFSAVWVNSDYTTRIEKQQNFHQNWGLFEL
jgi:hypothetical protein